MKFLFCIAALAFTTTQMLFGQTGTLQVEGEAVMHTVPEIIRVHIPIQSKNASYEQTTIALTETYNNLSRALVKAGLKKEDLRSSGLDISENYIYSDRERKKDGFIGNIRAEIKMPHTDDMLNAFMKTMSDERFNFGYQLNFTLSEPQKKQLREEAIKAATDDAVAKAETLAANLNVRLISISEIKYGGERNTPSPLMRMDAASMKSDMEEISLNPREIEIRQSVAVAWVISN